jgi:hypothetical protein
MARIRKINVSQIEGNTDGVLPAGTIAAYEINDEYVLRVHDGVTEGGMPFPNAPSIVHNNDINLTIDNDDSSTYTWNFGQTGTLTAPGMAVFGGTDGIVVDNLNNGIAALFNNGDVYITGGESLRFTGLNDIEGGSSAVLRFWNGEGRHSSGNDTTELVTLNVGNDADAGDPTLGFFKIITEKQVGGEKEWKFDSSGALTFPDGSVQTTAYALPSGPLYVIVNESKEISTSTNGEIWTTGQEITTSATNFQRVAVGTNAIVYIGQIEDPNNIQNTEDAVFYQTSIGENATAARVTQFEIGAYDFKEVIWAEDKFVLVGHTIVEGPDEPVLFTSTNGIDWTATDIDPSYVEELGVNEFDDVYYDGSGFLITATGGIDNGAGGFYVTDPTSALGQNNFVPFVLAGEGEAVSVEFEELAYGGTGWIARDENDILHSFTGEFTPGGEPAEWTPLDVATPFKEFCGLDLEGGTPNDPSIVELEGGVIDDTYWIIFTTGDGHVGATSDLGANWTFSIPEPSTATMSFVTIDLAGITTIALDVGLNPGEKITISNSEIPGLDGTYYVDNPGDSTNANILYTDSALTTPKISQAGGTPGESNVVTLGAGQYLDAASIINGFMYVANDDEQIFRSTDGATWTKVDDQNNSFSYWNDIGYNPQFGQAGLSSSLTNGEYTLALESTGTLTLPAGGTISEGIVTSNPTIQLTPATPDVASQKLVIKGGGGQYYITENGIDLGTNNNVWEVTDSATFYVYAPTRPNETLYWWIVPEESGISTTMSGTVELGSEGEGVFTFTVISDAYEFRVRVSPTEDTYDPESIGVESVLINGDAPSYGDYHLHLTTGDLTETSIFLGTDDHNVRTTTDGNIQITTPSQVNKVWEFGTNGDITLPGGMTIGNSNGSPTIQVSVDNPINILAQGSGGSSNLQWINDFQEPTAISAVVVNSPFAEVGDVQIVTGAFDPQNPTAAEHSWTFGTDGNLTLPGDIRSENAINIDINLSDSTLRRWTFGEDGDLNIPGGLTTDSTRLQFNTTNSEYWVLNSDQKRIEFSESAGYIKFGTATKDNTGAFTDIELFSYGTGDGTNAVYISAGGSPTNNRWKFGGDGHLTLPGDLTFSDGTIQTTAYTGTGTGAITFTGNEIEGNTFGGTGTIITKTVDNTGDNFSTGAGSIGFLNFGADGTIQNVKAGWTVTFASGVTRTVSQDAFQPLGTYWNISFDSAYIWSAGDVMPVTFSSPDYVAGTDPQVTLTAGTASWTFDNTGDLTLPAGGDIVNSAGVSQTAQRVEGSWTVTAGTNTYSFTLPSDGTYVMWVKGNIPNGIITWNATASVSNTNVPAIGTQYAWNYTGGGTPISLTSIPDQIRGVAGTISTDATYAGTTSNRFDFGISNTSGESQTVYYGYTKI